MVGGQVTGSHNMFINGRAAARYGDGGWSSCPCCGAGYGNADAFGRERSYALFVNGRGIVRVGDMVNIHDQGYGRMVSGSPNFFVAR